MANLRSMIEIEIIKNDRPYRMFVPQGVPYAEAKEICAEMLAVVEEWERQSKELAEKDKEPIEPEVVS